jgi:hypothetical protein
LAWLCKIEENCKAMARFKWVLDELKNHIPAFLYDRLRPFELKQAVHHGFCTSRIGPLTVTARVPLHNNTANP